MWCSSPEPTSLPQQSQVTCNMTTQPLPDTIAAGPDSPESGPVGTDRELSADGASRTSLPYPSVAVFRALVKLNPRGRWLFPAGRGPGDHVPKSDPEAFLSPVRHTPCDRFRHR